MAVFSLVNSSGEFLVSRITGKIKLSLSVIPKFRSTLLYVSGCETISWIFISIGRKSSATRRALGFISSITVFMENKNTIVITIAVAS